MKKSTGSKSAPQPPKMPTEQHDMGKLMRQVHSKGKMPKKC